MRCVQRFDAFSPHVEVLRKFWVWGTIKLLELIEYFKEISKKNPVGDQRYTPEIMDEILTTARDLELEVNEDDIEELIMGHEDELTTEEP
ncbi:hypothetical protein TNCV_4909131 [Trichonephila clavipes]|uniref:Uncharacterized protein n=1 Tax=Trichonephila clavipes TaxID=2585209 RepID=A0A8X6RPN3_TRICX|nr:hypothetical protein TNCV_4909131 [Trichonephila clavipes]